MSIKISTKPYNVTYCSQNAEYVQNETQLSLDELEALFGRFRAHSSRAGQLRGELRDYGYGHLELWSNFPARKVWSSYE